MIINRSLIREVLTTGGAATLVMLSIFLMIRWIGFLRQVADGDLPVDSVLVLLLLKLVTYMDVILPLMLFVAILMVLGRWNRDNEMVVVAACGIGLKQFLWPMLWLVTIAAVIVGSFALYLSPLSVRVSRVIEHEYKHRNEISGVIPGVFTETRGGRGVYFIEDFDEKENKYRDLFVYNSSFDKEGVVIAEKGFQTVDATTNNHFLILQNGTRYEANPGSNDYRVIDFEKYAIRLQQGVRSTPTIPMKGMTTMDLLNSQDSDEEAALKITEWHWRVSKILSLPTLFLFALAFSGVNVRRSRLPNMFMAFLIYFAYANVLGLGVAMMRKGVWNPHFGLWVIHLIFLTLALYLFARSAANRSLTPHFTFLRPPVTEKVPSATA
ncbi:MAG: LPS export ABC transporter permease LptF [Arenicellales bacterium WSBS_2016_MAG_OTU3]